MSNVTAILRQLVVHWSVLLVVVSSPSLFAETPPSRYPIVAGFERMHSSGKLDDATAGRLLLGELNCVACHRVEDAASAALLPKQAPVLDEIGARAAPQWLQQFLADPHAVKPGTTMPDLFSGVAEDDKRSQVEALTHFLASTGAASPTMPDKTAIGRGDTLFHHVGCVGCHGPQRDGTKRSPAAVPLGELTAKYSIHSLAAFLKNPHTVRPSGRMPNLNLNDQEARDVANYLLRHAEVTPNLTFKYFEGSWENIPDFRPLAPKATGTSAGFDLGVAPRTSNFGLRFEGFVHIPREGDYTFHLGSDDGSRLSIDDRQILLNDGLHPFGFQSGKTTLTAGAHPVAVDFFQGGGEWELRVEIEGPELPRQPLSGLVSIDRRPPKAAESFRVDPQLAARGRELFGEIGCANCHQLRKDGQRIASQKPAKPLAALAAGRGCLADDVPTSLPQFDLNAKQRASLSAALAGNLNAERSARDSIHFTLTTFNCYACHSRDQIGGVEEPHNEFFQTTIPEMGDEGRIPPLLDGVGDKLTADWMRHVFNTGSDDRPYMVTRMPKFGSNQLGRLVEEFAALDLKQTAPRPEFELPDYRVKSEARYMVGDKALSCIKCHNFGQLQATGITAADLLLMPRRLREDWFYRYMINPQEFRPGTRMPSAWPNGDSILPKVLDGDTQKQLAAIWLYLADGNKAAVPTGLIRDPIELTPKDEPVIYRNFIAGLSPRAIAVGYPEKVNLAYDADRFSLGLIWHGAFIDASKHWSGRGAGFQHPLGDHVIPLVTGSPLAVLAGPEAAWPNEPPKELGYQFRGYHLNSQRQPVFRYEYETVGVDDFPEPVTGDGDASLRRTLTLRSKTPPSGMYFRAASGAKIETLPDGWRQIDGAVRMRFNAEPLVRQQGGRLELLVPVEFNAGRAEIVQEIVW